MKLLNLFFKREMAAPMLALSFASLVSVAFVIVRVVWTGQLSYAFLIWNLVLAWLPLVLAVLAHEQLRKGSKPGWRLAALAGAWLLFLPNCPYICTDLIHLNVSFHGHYWVDMVLILTCAFTGLVLGFVSLYLMQSIVTRMYGRVAGWLFVFAVAGLSSLGVYLGRFLRINSWDVLLRPGKIYHGIDFWMNGASHGSSAAFLLFFAAFFFVAYVMLYALTHLPKSGFAPAEAAGRELGAA